MRDITEIIIHCADTPEGTPFDVEDIRRWHKERGFNDVGYHYVIYIDGRVVEGRPLADIGAHCVGHNEDSIGICYIGGRGKDGHPKDTRTPGQKEALQKLVRALQIKFPSIKKVSGHNEHSNKSCPCFDVWKEF